MTGVRPKQYNRMGEFYLEEAVLDVLLDARHERECVGAADIGRRAGIFREKGDSVRGAPAAMNDAIVSGILIKLVHAGRVQRCDNPKTGKRGYELSDSEFEQRRDDV